MEAEPFRTCRMCGAEWKTWQEFLLDSSVKLVGLQAFPGMPVPGVVVFLHDGCGSISVKAPLLRELIGEKDPGSSGDEPCDGCFRDLADLCGCDKPCVISSDRQLTRQVAGIKKTGKIPG